MRKPRVITKEQAKTHLLGHHGLLSPFDGDMHKLLRARRCIQLDPLDRVGTAPDLIAIARIPSARRGDVLRELVGYSFEHMFKVKCLLPAEFLPWYRAEMQRTGWFSYRKMCGDPDPAALVDVLAELRERGPLLQSELTDRGMHTQNYDHPWARKATVNMVCLDALHARCDTVVVERTGKGKRFDLVDRVFPASSQAQPASSWASFVIAERVAAAGLLSLNAGPWWALAKHVRTDKDAWQQAELVQVQGLKRRYLAPVGFLDRSWPESDDRMRALGPLDPLIWDRDLVQWLWDFDYVWEVYKPAKKRRWGYYVCPLLHRGELVGRFEGHREDGRLVVDNVWPEVGFEQAAFDRCIDHLSAAQ